MPKTVLLTGAGGFIGAHTLNHLLAETDWTIISVDSFRHRGKTDRVNQVLSTNPDWADRVHVLTHDLTVPFSSQAIHRIEQLGRVDYIINMASESHVDRSIFDPVPFVRNNVDLVLTMLELARSIQPEKFIQISTDEVYGPMVDGQPFPEWSRLLPSNPYSASKAAQEAIAISWWRTYNVPLIIANAMNAIGEMQDREKFLPRLIAHISRGEEVTIHGRPGLIGSRFYLHARNIADALLFMLREHTPEQFPQAEKPSRFNIVGDRQIDNLELAEMVANVLGMPLHYRLEDFHTTRPGHDPHYGLDGSRLAAAGWKSPVPFLASLARTIEWTLEHPEWLIGSD